MRLPRIRIHLRRRSHVHVFTVETVKATGVTAKVPRCSCGYIDRANVVQTVTNRKARRAAARRYARSLTSNQGSN